MRDLLDRLREDPGRKTLGELIQEREAAAQEIENLRQRLGAVRVPGIAKAPPKTPVAARVEVPRPLLGEKVLLRLKDVSSAVGLCRSSIYRLVAEGTFPKPVHVSERSVRWRAADIEAWIEARSR